MMFEDYLQEVIYFAKELGYNEKQVLMFKFDIEDCYNKGLTIQECLDREF